jgi:tetratricopeptide (TPR) repeat protein
MSGHAATNRRKTHDAAEARLLHVRVLVELGELSTADAEVAQLLDERPQDLAALSLFAKIKHMRGQLSEAVACWAQLHARAPHNEAALLRLRTMLELARDPERGAGEFVALGQLQLWRKPAALLELEEVFRLFLARRPDEARGACERLASKYRGRDAEMYKLAVLARAWIAELAGELDTARIALEDLGRERGFETDLDRIALLVVIYERLGAPEQLEKAVHICQYLERTFKKISVLGRLAVLYARLGEDEKAALYQQRALDAFRERMHRPTFAEVVEDAARVYLPLERLSSLRFSQRQLPADATVREQALATALAGRAREASELFTRGGETVDLKYRAELLARDGRATDAARLFEESLIVDPDDLRVIGWLLEHADLGITAFLAQRPELADRARRALEMALRVGPRRVWLWKQLAVLHRVQGRDDEAARCEDRGAALEQAARLEHGAVGRILAAAVYHFLGKAKGLTHEVWAERRPVAPGRGGYLDEILGTLTPEMKDGVRNTFLSVREYARAQFPHRTRDILDYTYTYKVTKEDEPSGGLSAGLPTALAFLSVFLARPVPQDLAASGVLVADSHDVLVVRAVGEPEYKVRGAYNRNLRLLILPEANREQLKANPQVPPAICEEIVGYAASLDTAVTLTFGENVWLS